jgi:hypothetical protein
LFDGSVVGRQPHKTAPLTKQVTPINTQLAIGTRAIGTSTAKGRNMTVPIEPTAD